MKLQHLNFLANVLAICLFNYACLQAEAIVGGRYAKDGQFGYHVSVEASGKYVCGGGIVNDRFVITAANCIIAAENKLKSSSIKVIAGTNDLNLTSVQQNFLDVQEVFLPVEYNSSHELPIGDIAILKLKTKLSSHENLKLDLLQLPENESTYQGVEATITGFGWNVIKYIYWPEINVIEETDGYGDGKLRYANAFTISNDYAQKWEKLQLNDKHLCAYVEQNDPDTATGTCTGDVGGPLMYNNTLIGILSKRRDGCREDEQTAIYTRVSSYVDFISKIINEEYPSNVRHITLS